MSTLSPLARALIIREIGEHAAEPLNGAALAVLRSDTLTGSHDDHQAGADEDRARDAIMAIGADDMPPPTHLVSLLLETASQREGGIPRAAVWRAIGIKPNRGRDLLARNAQAVDWPIWFTLREFAFRKIDA